MVACSSTIRTPEQEDELERLGFNMFIETPVTNDIVNNLIKILIKREENMNDINHAD